MTSAVEGTGTVPRSRGGWWHEYVCPTHGTELGPPDADGHPCRAGCRWHGEPYASAWLALAHQRNARSLRRLAAQAAAGDEGAAGKAHDLLEQYAAGYAALAGENPGAREWMVPGRLFQQALSESIWAAGVAGAVWTLAERPGAGSGSIGRLAEAAVPLLRGLHDTVLAARARIELRSNYLAWCNAAGALCAGALDRLGAPPPEAGWRDGPAGLYAQVRAAVLADGWEWEAASYYHAFVLLAYVYTLRGTDPAELPADVADRLAGMVAGLGAITTPDGVVPALHDSPFRRPAAQERRAAAEFPTEHRRTEVCELAEVAVLAPRLLQTPALDRLAGWCREVLAGTPDAHLLTPTPGWFTGPPRPAPIAADIGNGSVLFRDAGYAVLRPGNGRWQALLDFGPHGGSHGHLDKLALYLYGDRVAWQPDPGMVPYGSRLRADVYRATRAHPAFSVDGAEQAECAGSLLRWTRQPATTVVVAAADAYPGVAARRHLVLCGDVLLDVLELRASAPRQLVAHLRPAVPVAVRSLAGGGWRTDWGGAAPLAALHACSAPSRLEVMPGWGPADDPAQPAQWLDWSTRADTAVFATVWLPEHHPDTPEPATLAVRPEAVVVDRPGAPQLRHPLTLGEQ